MKRSARARYGFAALAALTAAATVALSALVAPAVAQDDWMGNVRRPPAAAPSWQAPRRFAPRPVPQAQRQPQAEPQVRPREGSARSRASRTVLALFDGTQEPAADRTRIHRYLELPLNHLGFKVDYWDLRQGLPPADRLDQHRAVVTWFAGPVPEHRAWLEWAANAGNQGAKLVVLEHVGAPLEPAELFYVNGVMRHIGGEIAARWVGPGEAGSIVERNSEMVDFEHKLDSGLPGYMVVDLKPGLPKGGTARSHLTVESRRLPGAPQARSAVVLTGPGGGFAAPGYVRSYDHAANRVRWVINPFAFLAATLEAEKGPVPDTTTVSGRRLYFSHVDGSGWTQRSIAGRDGDSVADVVARELVEAFADLPVTIGVVASDVLPGRGDSDRATALARRLLALPQVEAASSTYSHPYVWQFFADYDRGRELARVHLNRALLARAEAAAPELQLPRALAKLGRGRYLSLTDRSFLAVAALSPRAAMAQGFDLAREVKGALEAVQALAPGERRAALYQWSGDMAPFEGAVRSVRAAGARNLNGGASRLDASYPSLMYVSPLARPVGAERQIYAVNASDLAYTDGWRGSYDGISALAETWERTEAPRRLKGMNLHYTMVSGERPESVAAIRGLLQQVRAMPLAPVTAARYAAIADAFFDVEIARTGPMRWRVSNRGALQTVRFDDAAGLHVDVRNSVGVLGYTHTQGALYVALDEAQPDAIVAVSSLTPRQQGAERPYLVESRWQISKLRVNPCGFEFEAHGFGGGEMTWANVRPPGPYTVHATRIGETVEVLRTVAVERDLELKLKLDADATGGTRVRMACARTSGFRTGASRR